MSASSATCVLFLLAPNLAHQSLSEYPLPLTERLAHVDLPLSALSTSSSPPPVEHTAVEHAAPVVPGLIINARTRITTAMAVRGTSEVAVGSCSGFQAGALVVLNPGGATEERIILRHPQPFVLETTMSYSHGPGEQIVQVAPPVILEDTTANAKNLSRISALLAFRGRHRKSPAPHWLSPDAPLLSNVSHISSMGTDFVMRRVGAEAAAALFVSGLLALCALGCIIQMTCEYSLCCLGRSTKVTAYKT